MTAWTRLVVVGALAVAGLGALAAPAPAQVPGKNGRIVFTRVVNFTGDVWIMNADGSAKLNLTPKPAGGSPWSEPDERDGALSPRGDFVAFVRDGALYRVRADGSQQPFGINASGEYINPRRPDWSPDGFRLLFGSKNGTNPSEIFVVPVKGGPVTNLTTTPSADEIDPAWSPVGNKIAFVSDRSGNREVYLANADGTGTPANVSNTPSVDESMPAFSPDGTKLAWVAPGNGGTPDVFVRTLKSSAAPINVTNNPATDDGPSFSADGKRLVFSSDRNVTRQVFVSAVAANASATSLTDNPGVASDDVTPDWGSVPEVGCEIRSGFNVIIGTAGNDKIKGTAGADQILGLGGNDTIDGGGGDDHLCGGPGRDTVTGGKGKDIVYGGAGNDVLNGNGGRDLLGGGAGDDRLSGGAGDDVLDGGPGNDKLTGDGGKDRFPDRKGRNVVTQ